MSIRQKRVADDYKILRNLHKDGVIDQVKGFGGSKSADHLAISFKGPKGTPYHKGIYKLEVKYGPNYPYKPPYVRLHTPIWHPNYWPNPKEYPGKRNICLALVDNELVGKPNGWSPAKNIATVIQSIIAMMHVEGAFFNPTDVFNKKAAVQFMRNKKEFINKAQAINKKYAKEGW
ncbi:MAG: ubiquitin-conjugating enzyme family protein [Candidatus Heimdallarchaeota archaeon]|nr:ubiquitin-conjugating enzyme family protein [Candidatus Heimdallarchaeota archaeon]MDH5644480.1 ubiquitin-conjugating enzyme family protein [Candidatus Heimdallarchaeota archaeon]